MRSSARGGTASIGGGRAYALCLTRSALLRRRIRLDDVFRRPLDRLERARDEIAAFIGKIQGFAGRGLAEVRDDRSVQIELEASVDAAAEGKVPVQEVAGA